MLSFIDKYCRNEFIANSLFTLSLASAYPSSHSIIGAIKCLYNCIEPKWEIQLKFQNLLSLLMLTLVDAKLNFFMISGADGPISGFSCMGKTTEISKETEPGMSLSRSGGHGT